MVLYVKWYEADKCKFNNLLYLTDTSMVTYFLFVSTLYHKVAGKVMELGSDMPPPGLITLIYIWSFSWAPGVHLSLHSLSSDRRGAVFSLTASLPATLLCYSFPEAFVVCDWVHIAQSVLWLGRGRVGSAAACNCICRSSDQKVIGALEV